MQVRLGHKVNVRSTGVAGLWLIHAKANVGNEVEGNRWIDGAGCFGGVGVDDDGARYLSSCGTVEDNCRNRDAVVKVSNVSAQ